MSTIFKLWFYIQGMLIILKITGMLNISWIFILIPIWLPIALGMLILGIIGIIVFIDMFRIN